MWNLSIRNTNNNDQGILYKLDYSEHKARSMIIVANYVQLPYKLVD